jgi:uncharacterized protein (TIGR02145 family)
MKKLVSVTVLIFILLSSCTNTLTPPIVRTLSASAQSATTITATGEILSDYGLSILSYGLCLSEDSLPTIKDNKKEHLSEKYTPGIEFSESFTGLAMNKTYYVRAYAINSDGVSYGKSICVKTTFSPVVTNSVASEITMTAATLTATINPLNTNAENWFEYWFDGGSVQKVAAGNSSGSTDVSVSIKLKGLAPGKTYSFTAKSKNDYGTTASTTSKFETYGVSDYDGNLYHTVTIGTQTWLKENLQTTHYANGDVIPKVSDLTAWGNLSTGAYCNYNNSDSLANIYGHLYNWYVGTDPRGLIVGWHTPTGMECVILRLYLGDYYSAGPALMETGHIHWLDTSRPATNSTGFTALPNGGVYSHSKNSGYYFTDLQITASLWTSDLFNSFGSPILIDRSNCYLTFEGLYFLNIGDGLRLISDK